MSSNALRIAALVIALHLSRCGVLTYPAIEKLPPDQQRQVDQMWNNMLAPPARLDRQTLLDTLVLFQLHIKGVDRALYRAEKQTAAGRVVMELDFDRGREFSPFTVTLFDHGGNAIRTEAFSDREVKASAADFFGGLSTAPEPQNSAAIKAWAEAVQLRVAHAIAATQPAR